MQLITRRRVSLLPLSLCLADDVKGAPTQAKERQPNDEEWSEIRKIANRFVFEETPANLLPFQRAVTREQPHKHVYAHYFIAYPLSLDNKDAEADYYTTNYLSPSGENGKFADVGGLLRDRPVPVGPWETVFWRELNFAIDILRASNAGLDGFGLDIVEVGSGHYAGEQERLLRTAREVAPEFRILLEPDMGILRDVTVTDLISEMQRLVSSGNVSLDDRGRIILAPFWAENKPPSFWRDLLAAASSSGLECTLFPIFLNPEASILPFLSMIGGVSSWGSRNPEGDDLQSILRHSHPKDHLPDDWMLAITPQDVRPKTLGFWESKNSALFRHEWAQAISGNYSYVQLVTWNDFSESTMISPSKYCQYSFFDLTRLYIGWFKTGVQPRISTDAIYYFHRRQLLPSREAQAARKLTMQSRGVTPTDEIEAVVLLTKPARVVIEIAGQVAEWTVAEGISAVRCPAQAGRPVFRLVRDGVIVVSVVSKWMIEAQSEIENPCYAGGSSTRD